MPRSLPTNRNEFGYKRKTKLLKGTRIDQLRDHRWKPADSFLRFPWPFPSSARALIIHAHSIVGATVTNLNTAITKALSVRGFTYGHPNSQFSPAPMARRQNSRGRVCTYMQTCPQLRQTRLKYSTRSVNLI